MIQELREKMGMALLLVTHDLGVVAKICDTVAIMYAGKIVEYGTLEEVFNTPKHPYTKGLFKSLPNIKHREEKLKPNPRPYARPNGSAGRLCVRATLHLRYGGVQEEVRHTLFRRYAHGPMHAL